MALLTGPARPGAIYSSQQGDLLEHPPTVPNEVEERDWKAERRKRKNAGADGQRAIGGSYDFGLAAALRNDRLALAACFSTRSDHH